MVASTNAGKVREIRHELMTAGLTDWQVESLDRLPNYKPPDEDQPSFTGNAIIKAMAAARYTGQLCLADDSGLCVDGLGGRPGIHSARYAGNHASDADNNARLMAEIAPLTDDGRIAFYRCVIALALPNVLLAVFSGELAGRLISTPRGTGGFGYDPYFFLPDHACTAAELPLEVKAKISHRGQAIRRAIKWLERYTVPAAA